MKNSTKNLGWALLLITAPLAYAAYLYPSLPDTIPTHFNISGEADAYGGKDSIFLGPGIMAVVGIFVFILLSNIKSFDPKRYKADDDNLYKKFALFTVAFLSMIGFIIVFSASNHSITIGKLLLPALGIAFAGFGWYMPKIHQNYFAGFKLPWTLENEDNWNETHKLAGKIWIYGGVAQAIAAILLPNVAGFIVFFSITFIMVIIPTVFSYRMFKRGNTIE
ncbi:MAG: SdpI family protein [Bacteroidetes bacterium]|nr:SdpI family protein [Bacteroidota bacterium]